MEQRAKFIGATTGSLGYTTGQEYRIRLSIRSGMLWIVRADNGQGECPYQNLKTFYENWQPV